VDRHATPRRRLGLALLSVLLCLLAPVAWALTLDSPSLRADGAAAWAVLGVALLLGAAAATADRRLIVRLLVALDVMLAALFAWAFFGLAALHPQPAAEELQVAPAFTLPDEQGRPVSLAAELARGPVLLAFYRGHW
jgi:hypothetical protein